MQSGKLTLGVIGLGCFKQPSVEDVFIYPRGHT